MTGASLALIIIPIASTVGLVVWLMMVFSADGHPRQGSRNPAVTPASTPGTTAERLPTAAATANPRIEAAACGATAGQFRPAA
jgi:hypothetical protein